MKKLCSILAGIVLLGCSPEPKPIAYGTDKCDFCRMTIVEPQFAAELVTTKGKVYKFDAIECMLQYRQTTPQTSFALQLVSDYLNGGDLQAAETSTFLISPELPSPMGANLSAFSDKAAAQAHLPEQQGRLYDWDTLLQHFNEKRQTQ